MVDGRGDGDDEEEFSLSDHPGYTGPKAGDPEMNRARDIAHLDVTRSQPQSVSGGQAPLAPRSPPEQTMTPKFPLDHPLMVAWFAFRQTPGYFEAERNPFDLFLAGWTARDSQPKE